MSKIKYAVIGAGKIASSLDAKETFPPLSHANAITQNRQASLVGFYDTCESSSCLASYKWSTEQLHSLESLLDKNPDVVIVATPNPTHADYLRSIAKRPPRLVICEKPLTLNHSQSLDIIHLYKRIGIPLWVNYQRRLDPTIRHVRSSFRKGILGKLLSGSIHYAKGIKHNGSHAIDLLRFIFGEPSHLSVTFKRRDFFQDDPSVAGTIIFINAPICLIPCDENSFSIFEMDLIFEYCRIRLSHSGTKITVMRPVADPLFPGYQELLSQHTYKTGYLKCMSKLVQDSIDYLGGKSLHSPLIAENIIDTQHICEQLAV